MSRDEAGLGLLIGRFQPFHHGHEKLCRVALEACERLLIILGSTRQARSIKNPWNEVEREAMIRASLPDIAPERLIFEGVPDVFYNEQVWLDLVEAAVAPHAGSGPVTLFGHHKDASSYYLALFPRWRYVELPDYRNLSATPIREALLAAGHAGAQHRLDELGSDLPVASLPVLHQLLQAPEFAEACAEFEVMRAYRESWAGAPYTPIFVTVDALVECADQVLLVQRGRRPGLGLWALPGGFLDRHERLEAGARRELAEETGLDLAAHTHRLLASRPYDAPERSTRGRFVTHLYHFKLDAAEVPPVLGADDAAAARWWRREDIDPRMMFEDHHCILQHALDWY